MASQSSYPNVTRPDALSRSTSLGIEYTQGYTSEDLETFCCYAEENSQDNTTSISLLVDVEYSKFRFQASRHMTVNEVVRTALTERGIIETTQYRLLINGRVLTSGTLQELDIDDGTEVHIVENSEVSLKFCWCEQPDRKHILPIRLMKTDTTREIKEKLTEAFREFFPHYDLTNRSLVISRGHDVLNDVLRPMLGHMEEEEDAEFTVHIIPSNENWMPLKLKYKRENDDGDEDWAKGLVFVPKAGTIGQMREEIGKIVSGPSSSLKIKFLHQIPVVSNVELLDHDFDSDDDRFLFAVPYRRRKFGKLNAPDKAKLSEYPDLLQDTCMLRVEQCPEISLTVKVTSDISSEITILSLSMNRFEPLKKAFEKIREVVPADPRQVTFPQPAMTENKEKTVEDYMAKHGSKLNVRILTKSVLVTLRHCGGLFQDKKFFEDASNATIEDLQRFVEAQHVFRANSVFLYRDGNMLDSRSNLKDIGVGMGDVLEVRTTPNMNMECEGRSSQEATASQSPSSLERQDAHQLPDPDAFTDDTVECEPSTCAEPMSA